MRDSNHMRDIAHLYPIYMIYGKFPAVRRGPVCVGWGTVFGFPWLYALSSQRRQMGVVES